MLNSFRTFRPVHQIVMSLRLIELKEKILESLEQELLPLIFHTHPTKSFDILDEIR